MWVHHGSTGIEVRTPAKLNLLFEVLGKRDDGYHEIETLMVPVNLLDSLSFQAATRPAGDGLGPITLHCRWASLSQSTPLPQGTKNLVYRAVELLRTRTGIQQGASIRLVKRIPLQAGLGGGSSDAAAALAAANIGWRIGYTREQLAALAAELGSDIAFFLYGGPAICRGRGEQVEPLGGLGALSIVIAQPPMGLSTAEVYGRCRPAVKPRSATALCAALRRGSIRAVAALMHNGLQSAAAELTPWVDRLAAEFARVECPAHQLTGSGSCYFGLFPTAASARRAAARLAARRVGAVYVVRGAGGSFGQAL